MTMDTRDQPHGDSAPSAAGDRSLIDDVQQLIGDGRTLLEAEIAYHKSRALVAGHGVKAAAGWVALALALVFFALMALVVGLILSLASLVGPWFATGIVLIALIGGAGLAGWVALQRWTSMARELTDEPE